MTGFSGLEVRLLGRFVVLRDGLEIPAAEFGGRKVRTLLRILATRRGSFVTHDALTEMLWADRPPADPAANLQVLVNRARRALGAPALIVTGPGGYSLAGGSACTVDAEEFLSAIERAQSLAGRARLDATAAALERWLGEPLSEDIYADWARGYRERVLRARQLALEESADLALSLDDPAASLEFAVTAAELDPLRERAVLTLVRALAATGDRVAALGRYDQYRRALADELGLDPSDDAATLQDELLAGRSTLPTAGTTVSPSAVSSPASTAEFGSLPFVGREDDIALLRSILATAGTVLLSGPSGAGKSRLLDVVTHGTSVLSTRAFLAERDDPWSLVRGLAREVVAADVSVTDNLPKAIRDTLGWLLPELDIETNGVAPDPESRRALLVEALTTLLARTNAPFIVDDLQWADASSLSLLDALVDRLGTVRAIFAYRPDEVGARPDVAAFVARRTLAGTLVELGPLDAAEIAEMTSDPELAAELAATTDRTPLAVAEVLRALAAEGAIERTVQNRWRTLGPTAIDRARAVAIDGQRRVIIARAAAQSADAREVLHLLALIAREVPARLLAQVIGSDERDVLDILGSLAHNGLGRLGDRGWATSHDMVSDVLGDRLPKAERGRLHGLIATALDELDGEPSEVARHWLRSGDVEKAAVGYLHAATLALDSFADGEAINLASDGLAMSPSASIAAELHAIRADGRARNGDILGARSDLRDALTAHPAGPVRARLLCRSAALASGADDLVRAAELAELALVEAGGDPPARAQALEIGAILDMNLGRPERAAQRAGDSLAIYQDLGDARGSARVLDGRAMAAFLDGQIEMATRLLSGAANLFEDTGDLVHVITPRSTAGHGLIFGGQPEAGLAMATAAHDLAGTLGLPEGQSYSLWHAAEAFAAMGRTAEAHDAAREALDIAQRLGHRGWTATAWRAVGIAHHAAGDLDSALAAFEESLGLSANLNLFESWAAARCALVLTELGRLAAAEQHVTRSLNSGPPLGHFEGRLAQVELAAARSDPRTGQLAKAALSLADEAGMRQGRDRLLAIID